MLRGQLHDSAWACATRVAGLHEVDASIAEPDLCGRVGSAVQGSAAHTTQVFERRLILNASLLSNGSEIRMDE